MKKSPRKTLRYFISTSNEQQDRTFKPLVTYIKNKAKSEEEPILVAQKELNPGTKNTSDYGGWKIPLYVTHTISLFPTNRFTRKYT